jgi:hypothetical protein
MTAAIDERRRRHLLPPNAGVTEAAGNRIAGAPDP